jgi:hypothetical protein
MKDTRGSLFTGGVVGLSSAAPSAKQPGVERAGIQATIVGVVDRNATGAP